MVVRTKTGWLDGEIWVNLNDLILAVSEAQKPGRYQIDAIVKELKRLREERLNG